VRRTRTRPPRAGLDREWVVPHVPRLAAPFLGINDSLGRVDRPGAGHGTWTDAPHRQLPPNPARPGTEERLTAAYDWRRIHSATPQRNALTCRDGCAFLSGEGSSTGARTHPDRGYERGADQAGGLVRRSRAGVRRPWRRHWWGLTTGSAYEPVQGGALVGRQGA
jgi:hypothetical protein